MTPIDGLDRALDSLPVGPSPSARLLTEERERARRRRTTAAVSAAAAVTLVAGLAAAVTSGGGGQVSPAAPSTTTTASLEGASPVSLDDLQGRWRAMRPGFEDRREATMTFASDTGVVSLVGHCENLSGQASSPATGSLRLTMTSLVQGFCTEPDRPVVPASTFAAAAVRSAVALRDQTVVLLDGGGRTVMMLSRPGRGEAVRPGDLEGRWEVSPGQGANSGPAELVVEADGTYQAEGACTVTRGAIHEAPGGVRLTAWSFDALCLAGPGPEDSSVALDPGPLRTVVAATRRGDGRVVLLGDRPSVVLTLRRR